MSETPPSPTPTADTGRVSPTGYAHVRITVTDIARSRAFYDAVFGWDVAFEVPADADEATREQLGFLYDGVIYAFAGGLFGLRPVAPGDDAFDPDRVGLDHVSFTVSQRSELDAAVEVLDRLGVAHEPVKDVGNFSILELKDPDGIALELTALTG
ncbi:VOC family protein [Pseudokineococcus basanitobsidens]|uniref:VOC family protein n=1 Tax=Pseudokineococcus basanitobsidens TaxID=1926649 RepID=A0ABU8RHV5_9ACTN